MIEGIVIGLKDNRKEIPEGAEREREDIIRERMSV